MHSSRGIPVADEQPEVTIDLECVLRDLGFRSISGANNVCEFEPEETVHPTYWPGHEVQPRDGTPVERIGEEQSMALPASMPNDGSELFLRVSVFLEDRWRVAAQAYANFQIAGIDFLSSDTADSS